MKEWLLTVFLEAYQEIANFRKRVEGRVPDPSKPEKDYAKIEVDDIIVFKAIDESMQPIPRFHDLRFPVIYNHHYKTIEDMLETEGLDKVLPGVKSIPKGEEIHKFFPGYDAERIKKYGIHVIRLGNRIS